jgi:P27 family predicted phage terminase small subunit
MQKAADPIQAPVRVPACPKTLTGEAAAEWRRITNLLRGLGLVAQLDRAALAMYVQAWARWVDAEEQLATQGVIVKSPNGYPIQNPYLSVSHQAAKQMQLLLGEFGLSPAARHRLLGATKKTEDRPETTGWEGTLANVVG